MNFSLADVAQTYVKNRFVRARPSEQEKIIQDWIHKQEKSQALVQDLRAHLGDCSNKKILDIGSGNGGLSIALAQAGGIVSGIDIEPELHQISKLYAASKKVNVDLQLYDGSHMPFAAETFDWIVSVSVLEHVDDPQNILQEAYRVLKPNGIFFLAFPNRLWPKETHSGLWGITYLPYSWASWVVRRLGYSPLQDNNLHFYTYWNLIQLLQRAGQNRCSFSLSMYGDTTQSGWKYWVKKGLRKIGIPHQALLPHLMCVLRKLP